MREAGFWRRFFAYWIDALPIFLIVFLVSYFFLGFDETAARFHSSRPDDDDARWQFMIERNLIRTLSLILYLVYCGVMEGSPLRGTLGKWLLGMEVTGPFRERLTYAAAARRNCAKFGSIACLGLGCLAIAWSSEKRGWHDYSANTYVWMRRGREE